MNHCRLADVEFVKSSDNTEFYGIRRENLADLDAGA